ncbi:hypothetical protein MnTg02_01418 [bacterium MnTg02]|nr:hypothetical protein MnTg02_01418 [bacterium MnTg02]
MVHEFDSRTIGDHWQARPRGLRLIVREPAWRLNAHQSFSMTDGISCRWVALRLGSLLNPSRYSNPALT